MKLAQIRNLLALAEQGSAPLAAAALGLSAHALLRSIRDLEHELGTPLFKRGRKAMDLTPIGRMFVARAAAAQLELDRARHEISQSPASPRGLVAIGMSPGPHISILPQVLPPFQQDFSEVKFRIVESAFVTLERELRDGTLDLYVGPIWPHQGTAGLRITRLYDMPGIVVGRKGHPLASVAALAQLADAQWIATSRRELEPLFAKHGLGKPNIALIVETGLTMLAVAAASDALLLLSADWLPLIERMGLLTVFRLIETLDSPAIQIVTRTELPLTRAASCLHDLILAAVGMRSPPPI